MKTWTPTAAQCEIIKVAAARAAEYSVTPRQIRLEPKVRQNTTDSSVGMCMNVARVTLLPDDSWSDTDLFDCGAWADFRKGVFLTDDGRAVVQFAIRPVNNAVRSRTDDLIGDIQVCYVGGKIVSITSGAQHFLGEA